MSEETESKSADRGDDISIEDLTAVLEICKRLKPMGRRRLLDTITTFYGVPLSAGLPDLRSSNAAVSTGSDRQQPAGAPAKAEISPKEFVLQKQPQTGVERVVCLAFYLTHYRDTPHFKTLDISKLNTEAAQPKFANAALTVNDAAKSGYLIAVAGGNKQLSAGGELFVQALPNREEARSAMASARPRRKVRRASNQKKGSEVLNGSEHEEA